MLATAEEAMYICDGIESDKKDAEYYLLNYEKELKSYLDAKEEFMNYKQQRDENIGGGRAGVGNPTEQIAMKGIQFDSTYPNFRWLKAVEIVQRGLGERKNMFIKVRREAEQLHHIGKGRKGWVAYVQYRYGEEIEKRFIIPEVCTSERTIKAWWQEIIDRTVFVVNKI
jgi:hypothetical protein